MDSARHVHYAGVGACADCCGMTALDQNALDAAIEASCFDQSAMARANEVEIAVYNSRSTECVDHHATAKNIAAAITAAVEEEREACARIADARVQSAWRDRDNLALDDPMAIIGCAHAAVAASEISVAIRSRSSQGEK